MDEDSAPSLGRQMVRTIWLFQAGCALPITLLLGFLSFSELFQPYTYFYDFVADSLNAIMAAGIIFIVLVQRKVPANTLLTLRFETAKSLLATFLWLWLILDSAFGPWQKRQYSDPEREKPKRVRRAAVASILLFLLFYPTATYCFLSWRRSKAARPAHGSERGDDASTETAPLLSGATTRHV